ncbi:MAG: hypothetical protein RIB84_18815 [Sneathiellaceae bacterium]
MAEIATRKVYESDSVAVWEMELPPGASTGLHTHGNSYLFHVLEGATLETTDAQGKPLSTFTIGAGDSRQYRIDGDRLLPVGHDGPPVPVTHAARNVGDTTFREVLVEFKQPG